MSALRDAMSHAVLGWVKPELDATLRQAREEIELFAEQPTHLQHMQQCGAHLHQVQGTLRMVELHAPALVAEELEALALALQEGRAQDIDEACAVLMRGTVLLPDYLERLQSGHRDIPIVLLPLLNEIRAARGEAGLSEGVLFAPDLDRPLPPTAGTAEPLPVSSRASRLEAAQERLARALQAWPEAAAPDNAAELADATRDMLALMKDESSRRMLWVASSVAEALRDGALQASPAVRQGFASVVRSLRQAQEDKLLSSTPGQEPTRELLYQVANSDAQHPALDDLRSTFGLEAAEPTPAEIEHARSSLTGRNRALLDTVGGAVKEELLRIKDALDLHLRTGGDVAALESQVQHLTSVGETLGMMGLDAARGVVVEQRDALSDLIAGRRSNDEGVLLDIAGALLYVDASLDDQVAGLGAAPGDASDEAHSSEAMRTIEIVAQEAIRNFAAAREAFVAFIETNWNHEQLSDVPRLLGEVSGSLRILDLAPAAAHVDGVRRYVEVELVGNRRVPGGQQLDTLADAMASLEYYLEALRDRRPNREEILDVARASLENLRYSSAGAVADAPVQNVEPAVPALPQADPAAAAEPGTRENAAGEPPVFEWPAEDAVAAPADPALQIERFEAAPESGERLTLAPLELDESAHLADDQVARPEAESARIAPWTLEEDAPGERLELAPLELDDGAHGVEVDASASDEPLDIAVDTSEWTLEIEEDAPSPAPLAWEPEDTLQADGAGDPPPLDFQEALAHEAPTTEHSPTAEPLPPVALDAQVEDAPQATASSQPPSPVGDGPAIEAGFDTSAGDIDDEIRDVFLEELAEEVGSIAALVPHWREDLYDLERMRPIRRTFHTLKGSGRLVGARVLGEFAWKVENMLNRVLDGTRPPSPAVLDLLERSTLVLPQLEAALRGTGAVTADLHGLEAVADRLAEGEEAWYTPRASLDQAEAVAEAQVPPPLPPTDLDGIPASVDSVLREILEAEVQAHLKTVDAWLAMAATGAGNARVNEPLLRAFHTMNGAFAMADVPGITEVTGPAEQFLKRALPTNAPVTAEAVQAIDEAAAAIRQAIAALHADAPRIPRFEALNARLVALRDTLPQAKPTVLTVPDLPAESSQEAAQDEIAPPVLDGTLQDMDLSAYLDPAHLPGNQAPQDQAAGADDAGAPLATPAFDEDQERAAVQDVEPIEQVPVLDEALSLEEDAPAFAQDDEGSQDTALHDEAALDAAEQDQSAAIPPAEPVEADANRHFRGFELDATYSGRPAAEMTPITGAVALVPADAVPEALEPAPAAAAGAPAEDILVEEVPAEDAPAEDILVEGVSAEEEPAKELPTDRWTIAQDAAVEAVTEPQAPAIADTSAEEDASLESELGPAVFEVSQPVAEPVEFDFADGTVLADDAPASLGALDYDTPQDPAAGISLEEAESAVQGEELDAVLAEQAPVESDAAPEENAPAEAGPVASAQDPEPALQAQEPSPAEDFTWTEPPADVIESIALLPDPDADALTVATDDAHAPDIAPTQPEEAFVVSAQDAQEEAATVEALLGGDDGSAAVDAPQATDAPVQAGVEATAAAESIDALIGEPLPLDELDRDLVDIFVEEGRDLLDHSDGVLAQLRQAPDDHALVAALQRDLHTLKGGARMAGINAIGDLGHAIESLLEKVAANRLQLDRGGVQLLEQGFDGLHRLLTGAAGYRAVGHPQALIAAFDAMAEGRSPAPIDAPASQPAQAPASVPAPAPTEQAPPTSVQEAAAEDAALPTPQAEAPARQAEAPVAPVAAARPELAPLSAPVDASAFQDEEVQLQSGSEQVRVRADLLDRLVNNAGEVAIYRARLEQQLGAFRGAMAELDRTNVRLHDQLRRLDLETEAQIVARYQREQDQRDPTFDPLELDRFSTLQQLSRALGESAADLSGLQGVLDDLARQYDSLLQQQSRVSSELQDGLMQARMVPFEGIVPRLRRTLRQAANDTGKQVRLQLQGTHGELDRNVLERMTAPLEHLLRNALAHGLEAPQARREAGKAEEGLVTIALDREGSEMVLRVSDDGAGLNLDAIRARAEQRGLLAAGSEISRVDLERMILEPGFSTSETVSQLAGRGVGMDVVHNEVRALGGTLDIDSSHGKGTTFTLRLPQTLAVTRAVFVQVGETRFAVPVAAVSGIGRITRDRFTKDGASYVYAGEEYSLYDLGTLVAHNPSLAEGQEQIPLLLVRSGDLRAAVAVDAVLGNREIVVKPVGPQVSSIPGIYGATITGDGSVVVILDAAPLVRRFIARPAGATPQAAVAEQRHVPLVMVVDDSLTMRKVTGRVLERHNFEVVTARDGVEALERLEDRVPDLMLLDIEMPRMDGYELATAMKADARFAGVPIVMITSRSGDKHRQRAFEIGVQRYMGKPYQELDLMRNVYDLLGMARVRE